MAAKEFPLSVIIRAIDRVTAPMKAIQASVGRFGNSIAAKFKGVSERLGLPVLTAAAGRFGSAMAEVGRRVAVVGGALAALGAGAAVAAFRIVQSFADAGGQIDDTAQQIGISAEKLQEWRYAAKMSGVEAELLDNSLGILNKNLGKAFKGDGPAELLQAMNVKLRNANGTFKTTDQLLPEIADGLSKIRNPALRATAAAELFGRGGVKLLPLLNDGAAGIEKWTKRARELGIVMSNEAVKDAADFGDKLDDVKLSLLGVRNVIGTALLPVISKLTERFVNWLVSIRPRLQAWFEGFAETLPQRIEDLIKLFDELRAKVQPVINVFAWLVDKFGGANVIIGVLAFAIAVFLVPSLYAAATAFYALGVAILTTPVGWIIAAIVAIVAVLTYFSVEVENGQVKLTKFGKALKLIAEFTNLPLLLYKLWGYLNRQWDESVERLNRLWATMKSGFQDAIGWVSEFTNRITNMVPDWVKSLLGGGGANVVIGAMNGGPSGSVLGAADAAGSIANAQQGNVRVQVDLNNLPPGSRVKTDQRGEPQFELNQGFAFEG